MREEKPLRRRAGRPSEKAIAKAITALTETGDEVELTGNGKALDIPPAETASKDAAQEFEEVFRDSDAVSSGWLKVAALVVPIRDGIPGTNPVEAMAGYLSMGEFKDAASVRTAIAKRWSQKYGHGPYVVRPCGPNKAPLSKSRYAWLELSDSELELGKPPVQGEVGTGQEEEKKILAEITRELGIDMGKADEDPEVQESVKQLILDKLDLQREKVRARKRSVGKERGGDGEDVDGPDYDPGQDPFDEDPRTVKLKKRLRTYRRQLEQQRLSLFGAPGIPGLPPWAPRPTQNTPEMDELKRQIQELKESKGEERHRQELEDLKRAHEAQIKEIRDQILLSNKPLDRDSIIAQVRAEHLQKELEALRAGQGKADQDSILKALTDANASILAKVLDRPENGPKGSKASEFRDMVEAMQILMDSKSPKDERDTMSELLRTITVMEKLNKRLQGIHTPGQESPDVPQRPVGQQLLDILKLGIGTWAKQVGNQPPGTTPTLGPVVEAQVPTQTIPAPQTPSTQGGIAGGVASFMSTNPMIGEMVLNAIGTNQDPGVIGELLFSLNVPPLPPFVAAAPWEAVKGLIRPALPAEKAVTLDTPQAAIWFNGLQGWLRESLLETEEAPEEEEVGVPQ